MITVFTNGVLDILHVGHFNLLMLCRMRADVFGEGKVIVGLDSDEKVKKDKGKNRPYFSFEERKAQLLALCGPDGPLVDEVREFNSNEELYSLIKNVAPNFIYKSDQWKDNVVGSDIAEVVYVKTLENFSTTKIVERVVSKWFDDMETDVRQSLP